MKQCILTIIKNEQEYLYDFLKYHTDLGIDIFVFEDYGSGSHKHITDQFENVYLYSYLDFYPKSSHKRVTLDRMNSKPIKNEFYNQGLKLIKALNTYDWCWMIDNDEYITFTEPLEDVLSRYNDYDAILVYWENYGCSGHIYKPIYDKPIYEIFTEKCGYEQFADMKHYNICKFCVNMNKYNPSMEYKIHDADVNWIKPDGTKERREMVLEPLYLRHYITKSFEEYVHKLYVRGTFYVKHRKMRSFFEMHPELNDKIKNDKELWNYLREKYNCHLRDKMFL